MKTALVLLLSVAAISCAEDKKPADQKRLQSVTWDLTTHKLVWVVQRGTEQNGQFTPAGADRYEIAPDDAVMSFSNEKRGFTTDEAASLHKLLDTLSLYCAESVIWWDQGQGDKLDEQNAPKGEKVDTPKSKPANPPISQEALVASRRN